MAEAKEETKMNTLLRKDNEAQDHYRKDFVEVGTGIWVAEAWGSSNKMGVLVEQEYYSTKEDAEARIRAWGKRKFQSHNLPDDRWDRDMGCSWDASWNYDLAVREVMKRQEIGGKR